MLTTEAAIEPHEARSVSEAIASYSAEPEHLRQWMEGAYQRAPDEFREKALDCLQRSGDGSGPQCLVSFLGQLGVLAEVLLSSEGFRPGQRARIAAQAVKTDPGLFDALYDRMAQSNGDQCQLALRLLRMVETSLDSRQARRIIIRLMSHRDARVRSKAALLAGKLHPNPQWLAMQLYERDDRLRANGVEAFWGTHSEECIRLLWHAARGDTHCRVRANALYGIYLSGDPAVVPSIVEFLGEGEREHASAIWLIGRTGDPRFLPLVESDWKVAQGKRRNPILQAMTRIRTRIHQLEAGPSLSIVPSRVRQADGGWRTIRVSVRGPDLGEVPSLKPLEFVLTENGEPITQFDVRGIVPAPPLAAGFLIDERMGEWALAALEQCVAESGREDLWAMCTFAGNPGGGHDGAPAPSNEVRGCLKLDEPKACVACAEPATGSLDAAAAALADAIAESGRETRLLFVLTRDPIHLPPLVLAKPELTIHLLAPFGLDAPVAETVHTEWVSDLARVPGLVSALYRDQRCNYEIRYQCAPPQPETDSEISVSVYSPQGVGHALWTSE